MIEKTTNESKNKMMEKMRSVLMDVEELYLTSNNVLTAFDEDDDLLLETLFSPGVTVRSYISVSEFGYVIVHLFGIGTEVGKLHLLEVINEINAKLREGAFSLDKTGGLIFRSFIGYNESIGPKDVVRSYKTGIFTFLTHLDDVLEAIGEFSNLKEADFEIIDVEGTA